MKIWGGIAIFANIDKADCNFLINDAQFNRFKQLIDELELFTLILPYNKDSYQRTATILDIWYMLSTKEEHRILHPENAMIYPYRIYFLKIIKSFSIKRFIQLALYENERLAFICAIYLYMEIEQFVAAKMAENSKLQANAKIGQHYAQKSLRPYYDMKYIELENYPKQLAQLQNLFVKELQAIHQRYEQPFNWIMTRAIEEASNVYEAVFGLINDWGGRVP